MNQDIFYKQTTHWLSIASTMVVVVMVVFYVTFWYLYERPYVGQDTGDIGTYVEIPEGSTGSEVGTILESNGIIRSATIFTLGIQTIGKAHQVKSGTYFFEEPESLERIIERVTKSIYGLPTKNITLYEGEANFDYAQRLSQAFEFVDEEEFLRLAADKEGFLFPDTYTISLRATTAEVIDQLEKNFKSRIAPLQAEIDASPYTMNQIITMASLVETEAGNASYYDKQRVAGVLWKRYNMGMLLQADAVFSYIYKQHLPRVLLRHLEVDSPYNIYKYAGLPPGPIANPGIDAIRATLNPIIDTNIYYLTGTDGTFYYASTLSAHERNRRNYIVY